MRVGSGALAMLLALVALSGCVSVRRDLRAGCGDHNDNRDWRQMRAPTSAGALHAKAPPPSERELPNFRPNNEAWYRLESGETMLCVFRGSFPKPACTTAWWTFSGGGADATLTDTGTNECVILT